MSKRALPRSFDAAGTADQVRVSLDGLLAMLAADQGPGFVCQRDSKPGYSVTAYCAREHRIYRAHSPVGMALALRAIAIARAGSLRILDKGERLHSSCVNKARPQRFTK